MNRTSHIPKGFTLIELMVTVAIVAILAVIAYPSYQDYVRKSRMADGKAAILDVQLAQERFRANCPSYATSLVAARTCAASGLGLAAAASPDQWYNLALADVTATGYSITAAPQGDQAKYKCGTLGIVVAAGEITNRTAAATECW